MNGRDVIMPGTYIDSFFNMPGGQPDDDVGPNMSRLKGWTPDDPRES